MEEKLPFELPSFEGELKNDGTDLGTFKSVKTLKDAYDSLRSCFTKNAMELAKMSKITMKIFQKLPLNLKMPKIRTNYAQNQAIIPQMILKMKKIHKKMLI